VVFVDPVKVKKSPIARLRKKLGVNEFSEVKPSGEPNEDYMEPFTGIRGIKHTLAVYLMQLVSFSLAAK